MADSKSTVRLVEDPAAPSSPRIDERLIGAVEVVLEAHLGKAVLSVERLMQLKAGDSLPLDAALNADVELRLNGVTIARGELVSVGTNFGVRIAEIAQK